jgi:hypothetical protein
VKRVVLAFGSHSGINSIAIICIALFGIVNCAVAAKDSESSPLPPPSMAKPISVEVLRGEEAKINLESYGYQPDTDYKIRYFPRHGKLGELVKDLQGRAWIVYQHESKELPEEDEFFYTVRNPGALVSAKARVQIKILEHPPRLSVWIGDFGLVRAGQSVTKDLILANTGGKKFQGVLRMRAPWRVDVPAITVNPGERAVIPVFFEPGAAGNFSSSLSVDGPGGAKIELEGRAYEPLKTSPSRLRLQMDAGESRSATFVLTNHSPIKLAITFNNPDSLLPIDPVELEAGKGTEITVHANPGKPQAAQGTLTLTTKEGALSLPFEIAPLAGKLEVKPLAEIFFTSCHAGHSSTTTLALSNKGGLPLVADLTPPSWIEASQRRISILPGAEVTVELEARPAKPGNYREPVGIDAEGGVRMEIPASLIVSTSPEESSQESRNQIPRTPIENPTLDLKQLHREALRILAVNSTPEQIQILWKKPDVDVREYRFEWLEISSQSGREIREAPIQEAGTEKFSPEEFARERIRVGDILKRADSVDQVVKTWHPLKVTEIGSVSDGIIKAVFESPKDRPSLRIRITSVLADGSDSPFRTEIRVPLEPAKVSSKSWLWWVVSACLVLALSLLASRWLQHKSY